VGNYQFLSSRKAFKVGSLESFLTAISKTTFWLVPHCTIFPYNLTNQLSTHITHYTKYNMFLSTTCTSKNKTKSEKVWFSIRVFLMLLCTFANATSFLCESIWKKLEIMRKELINTDISYEAQPYNNEQCIVGQCRDTLMSLVYSLQMGHERVKLRTQLHRTEHTKWFKWEMTKVTTFCPKDNLLKHFKTCFQDDEDAGVMAMWDESIMWWDFLHLGY